MAQTPIRMPRHSYRPDGSKPYGPHGPMAPPPHMKVKINQIDYKLYIYIIYTMQHQNIFMQISYKLFRAKLYK